MSDWWAKKLGGQQQPQAPAAPVQRPSTPSMPYQQPAPPPPTQVPQQYAPQGQVVQQDEPTAESFSEALRQNPTHLPRQATANLNETQSCPGCGGAHYSSRTTGVSRGPAPAASCFDCGYPLIQSGSGLGSLGGVSGGGPTTPAKQVASGGWNPSVIIGKV